MQNLNISSKFINAISLLPLTVPGTGLILPLTEEETTKSRGFACRNTACGKVFTKPLKALNLHLGPKGFYDACPYCLTEITMDDEMTANLSPEKEVNQLERSPSCTHHFGYLCERSTKDVPDECFVCKDVVPCMLKKMRR